MSEGAEPSAPPGDPGYGPETASPLPLSRAWYIIDGIAHPLFSEGPYRPLKWMLVRFISTVTTDTASIGFGGSPQFTLLANEPPIVFRDFDPRQSDMTYKSAAAIQNLAHIECLGA